MSLCVYKMFNNNSVFIFIIKFLLKMRWGIWIMQTLQTISENEQIIIFIWKCSKKRSRACFNLRY